MLVKPKPLLLPSRKLIVPNERRRLPRPAPWIWTPKRFAPQMAVTRDVVGAEQFSTTTPVTSFNYTGLTIGAGLTNSAAVFAVVSTYSATQTSTPTVSATWNSVSAPLIITQAADNVGATSSTAFVSLLGLVNPTSGAQTLAVSITVAAQMYVYGVSFANVNQTGGTTTFAHSAGSTSGTTGVTSQALTLTTANGNWTLVITATGTGNGTSTVQLGGVATQDWSDNSSSDSVFGAAGNAASSTASAAWTAHNSSLDFACLAGVDIVAATSADVLQAQILT